MEVKLKKIRNKEKTVVKSKRVTQTQNPLWDQGFKNPRRQWSSNEDTTRKSVEGDEPPISKGRFISVICLKKNASGHGGIWHSGITQKICCGGGKRKGSDGKEKKMSQAETV